MLAGTGNVRVPKTLLTGATIIPAQTGIYRAGRFANRPYRR